MVDHSRKEVSKVMAMYMSIRTKYSRRIMGKEYVDTPRS
jgi:hypothetical protein